MPVSPDPSAHPDGHPAAPPATTTSPAATVAHPTSSPGAPARAQTVTPEEIRLVAGVPDTVADTWLWVTWVDGRPIYGDGNRSSKVPADLHRLTLVDVCGDQGRYRSGAWLAFVWNGAVTLLKLVATDPPMFSNRDGRMILQRLADAGQATQAAEVKPATASDDRLTSGTTPTGGRCEDLESPLQHRTLLSIQARPVEWLWRPFIPRRAITQIVGDSDVGKSSAVYSIISTITTGGRFVLTDQPVKRQRVLLLSAEEDAATMIKPALLANGADCHLVEVVESCAEFDSKGRMVNRSVSLERDIAQIAALVADYGDVGMIAIDPLTSYLGAKLDSNNNTQVRAVLVGLQRLAEEHGLAMLVLNHYGKGTGNSKTKVLGSTAFVAGPRCTLAVFRDPDDETKRRRLLVPVKCNLVPEVERTGRAFQIATRTVVDGDFTMESRAVEWFADVVHETADSIMNRAAMATDAEDGSSLTRQRQRIVEILQNADQPLSSKQVAEQVTGKLLIKGDKEWTAVRRLLAKMVSKRQITKDDTGGYYIT